MPERDVSPATEAGRALINDFLNGPGGFGYAGIDRHDLKRGILAIEQEAAAIDVERLAQALYSGHVQHVLHSYSYTNRQIAEEIVAAYELSPPSSDRGASR